MKDLIHCLLIIGLSIAWFIAGFNTKGNLRDYQVDITNDSTYIYDGNRLVSAIPFDSCTQFDKVMIKDNE